MSSVLNFLFPDSYLLDFCWIGPCTREVHVKSITSGVTSELFSETSAFYFCSIAALCLLPLVPANALAGNKCFSPPMNR